MSVYGSPWGVGSCAMRRVSMTVPSDALVVSIRGISAVTLTVSSDCPSSSDEIDGERIGDSDFDLPRGFLEARELRRYLIGAGQQIRRLEEAERVRRQRDGRAHRDVRDRHGGAGDDAAAAVADRSGDGSARVLRRGAGRERRDHESRHEDGRRSCEPVAAASLSRAPHHRLLLLVPSTRGASS